jgi:GTP-binding protein EngB required for normal cell division
MKYTTVLYVRNNKQTKVYHQLIEADSKEDAVKETYALMDKGDVPITIVKTWLDKPVVNFK